MGLAMGRWSRTESLISLEFGLRLRNKSAALIVVPATNMKKITLLLALALPLFGPLLPPASAAAAAPAKVETPDDKLAVIRAAFPKAVDIYDNWGKSTPGMNDQNMKDLWNKYKRLADGITIATLPDDIKKLKTLITKDLAVQQKLLDQDTKDGQEWKDAKKPGAYIPPKSLDVTKALKQFLQRMVSWTQRLDGLVPATPTK